MLVVQEILCICRTRAEAGKTSYLLYQAALLYEYGRSPSSMTSSSRAYPIAAVVSIAML